MKKKKQEKDILITKNEIRMRGWSVNAMHTVLPKPIYIESVPMWRLSDIERVESSIEFYMDYGAESAK